MLDKIKKRFILAAIRLSGSIYAWSVAKHAANAGYDLAEAARLAVRETLAVKESVVAHFEYQKTEQDILSERLARRYDIGMAMNEAANCAIVQKAAAKEDPRNPPLTSRQQAALEFQKEYLARIVNNS